jgi:hypothetical protein
MLGQLFRVVTPGIPLEHEAIVPEQQSKIVDPTGQVTPHIFLQLGDFLEFHVSA